MICTAPTIANAMRQSRHAATASARSARAIILSSGRRQVNKAAASSRRRRHCKPLSQRRNCGRLSLPTGSLPKRPDIVSGSSLIFLRTFLLNNFSGLADESSFILFFFFFLISLILTNKPCPDFCIMLPPLAQTGVVDNPQQSLLAPELYQLSKIQSHNNFVMLNTIHRISSICAHNRVPVRRGEWPSMSHLWKKVYRLMANSVAELNNHIQSNADAIKVLTSLNSLLGSEVSNQPSLSCCFPSPLLTFTLLSCQRGGN